MTWEPVNGERVTTREGQTGTIESISGAVCMVRMDDDAQHVEGIPSPRHCYFNRADIRPLVKVKATKGD